MKCVCDIKKLMTDGHEEWCVEHPNNKKVKKEPDEVKWFEETTPPPYSTPKLHPGIDWDAFMKSSSVINMPTLQMLGRRGQYWLDVNFKNHPHDILTYEHGDLYLKTINTAGPRRVEEVLRTIGPFGVCIKLIIATGSVIITEKVAP